MKITGFALFGVALLNFPSAARADSYTFESALDSFPDPYRFMQIAAINNQGAVTGGYSYNDFALGAPPNFTQAAVPGNPYQVTVSGLNSSNTVVGGFQLVAGPYSFPGPYQGFIYKNGVTTTVNAPNASSTDLSGINDAGDIVGFTDGANGFLLKAGTNNFQPINYPGAQETYPEGINNHDEIVGWYVNSTGSRGFTEQNGIYTTLNIPAPLGEVFLGTYDEQASGINDNGDVVGFFPGANAGQGYLYSNGAYSLFDYPGPGTSTLLKGINNAGQIVGLYANNSTGNSLDGFIATPLNISSAPEPSMLALPTGVALLLLLLVSMDRGAVLRERAGEVGKS